MNTLAALDDPALFAQSNYATASPCLRPSGFPSLVPHLCPPLADVWAVRKWGNMYAGFKADVICLYLSHRFRHPKLAPHALGKLLCARDKGVEHGHKTQWSGQAVVLAHAPHRAEIVLLCQDEHVEAATNPAPSVSSCLAFGAGLHVHQPSIQHLRPRRRDPAKRQRLRNAGRAVRIVYHAMNILAALDDPALPVVALPETHTQQRIVP